MKSRPLMSLYHTPPPPPPLSFLPPPPPVFFLPPQVDQGVLLQEGANMAAAIERLPGTMVTTTVTATVSSMTRRLASSSGPTGGRRCLKPSWPLDSPLPSSLASASPPPTP